MTESFIVQRIPERITQLGYEKYHVRYRDLTIEPYSTETIPAFNELWFIVGDPPGILLESAYGMYDSTGQYLKDNIHEHRGEIIVINPGEERKRVKFIQVIIVN